MNSLAVCVLLLTCSALSLLESCAETPPASVEWAGHTFREVRTLSALPPSLQTALGVGRLGLEGIADRDGKFNPTDVVDSKLPMRRLLVAGLEGDTALVAIEHGGRGSRVEVAFFSDTDRRAVVERTWTLFDAPRTLRALVDRLAVPPR
jgi:hypothetical protein